MTTESTTPNPDGRPVEMPDETLAQFRRSLEGPTLAPDEEGYDGARRLWNAMIDRRPALIARCSDAVDVRRCIAFARTHGVPLTVRGGGHNIGGRALAEGGLQIDFSPLRGVRVNQDAGSVEVEPGATLADLDAATQEHGLVVPAGIMSETGVAGLTLGGGFGWLSRRWGLTCDHLQAVELVTAQGDILHADEDSHPDLMWALRGGGGGLGVVTSFELRTQPLDQEVTAGMAIHTDRRDGLERFRRCCTEAPEELSCLLKLCSAPPAPFLEESVHGTPVAITAACHCGAEAKAPEDLSTLRVAQRGTAGPVADLFQPRPFSEFQAMFDDAELKGRRDYWKSEYIDELSDELAEILLDATARTPSPHSNIKVNQLGGAIARKPAGATAAGHRDAAFIVVVASAWEDPADDRANIDWVRRTWKPIHTLSGRGGYINFLTEDTGEAERNAAHGGVDLDRLERIRRRFDPEGLFAAGSPSTGS